MILSGDSEILTPKGEFPLSFLEDKLTKVWDGSSWLEAKPKRILETNQPIYESQFICTFSYEGMSTKVWIPFESRLVGNFNILNRSISRNISKLEIGSKIDEYEDNQKQKYKCFFSGDLEEISYTKELFKFEEKIKLIVNGLMITNY